MTRSDVAPNRDTLPGLAPVERLTRAELMRRVDALTRAGRLAEAQALLARELGR